MASCRGENVTEVARSGSEGAQEGEEVGIGQEGRSSEEVRGWRDARAAGGLRRAD